MLKWVIYGLTMTLGISETLYRIEAESGERDHWKRTKAIADASGGEALQSGVNSAYFFQDQESKRYSFFLPEAKAYQIWVRYRHFKEDKSSFIAAIRDDQGLVIGSRIFNFQSPLEASKLNEKRALDTGDEWVWESFEIKNNRSQNAQGSFVFQSLGKGAAFATIDCLAVSDRPSFRPDRPEKVPLYQEGASLAKAPEALSGSWQWSLGYPYSPGFFSGTEAEHGSRFSLALINCYSPYLDLARSIRLGFNKDHYWEIEKVQESYGIKTKMFVPLYPEQDVDISRILNEKKAPQEAKFKNLKGEAGQTWSLAYPPLIEAMKSLCLDAVIKKRDNRFIEEWMINGEQGGFLDTSDFAIQEFQKYLSARHGSIAKLNQAWKSRYASFDQIKPPTSPGQNFPCWSEFYTFSSEYFIRVIQMRKEIVQKNDPNKRPIVGMISNSEIFMPHFMAIRPMDIEQYYLKVLGDQPFVGTDMYCSDEALACELEALKSFAGGRPVHTYEWNTHTPDERISARSMWTFPAKGAQGIHVFQAQESLSVSEIGLRWSLYKRDGEPKQKLGPMADVAHEINRLSKLLMRSKPHDVVKPIGIYYSKIDLALSKPFESMWSCGVNSPYHIYSTLRSAGYQVTWVTPHQIQGGKLKELGGLVFFDAQHIPTRAAEKIEGWVSQGGVVVGDGFPGRLNELGQRQEVMDSLFGVKPKVTEVKKAGGTIEESTQGYGEVSIAAIDSENIATTMGEVTNHWNSESPLLKRIGDFQLSGLGNKEVEQTGGEVIGVGYGKSPGIVLNEHGKGRALYSSLMLGTIYDAECASPAFDTNHHGDSWIRLLGCFLKDSKVAPAYQTSLSLKTMSNLRVERALVDSRGNSFYGLINYLPVAMPEFELVLPLDRETESFQQVLWIESGTRKLKVLEFVKSPKAKTVAVKIPSFQTHGGILFCKEMEPMISLRLESPSMKKNGLLSEIHPNEAFDMKVEIYNPSGNQLKASTLEVFTPRGAKQSLTKIQTPEISAWGRGEFLVKIQAPQNNGIRDAIPLTARLSQANQPVAIASEVVWFEKE